MSHDPEGGPAPRAGIFVEDVLIVLAVAALFVLTLFCRRVWWGQAGLGGVLVLMGVVFWRRFRRVHRGFTGRDGGA